MSKNKPKLAAEASEATNWQAKADEYLAGWQRTQADFENYRRRTEEARLEIGKLASAQAYLRITPILDDFRRAFAHLPDEVRQSAWVTGVQQVEKHLRSVLESAGLEPIDTVGSFDPQLHEAIAYEDHPEFPDGQLIDIVEAGWKLGDKVIQPARVRVSRGKSSPKN